MHGRPLVVDSWNEFLFWAIKKNYLLLCCRCPNGKLHEKLYVITYYAAKPDTWKKGLEFWNSAHSLSGPVFIFLYTSSKGNAMESVRMRSLWTYSLSVLYENRKRNFDDYAIVKIEWIECIANVVIQVLMKISRIHRGRRILGKKISQKSGQQKKP